MARISKTKILKQIASFLEEHQSFVISGHVGADGDAIAACMAMAEILHQMGKKFELVFHDDPVDPRFNYFKWFDNIKCVTDIKNPKWDAAIICDVPGFHRLGDVVDLYKKTNCDYLRIDHHPGENGLDGVIWEDLDSSSSTVMVYRLLKYMKVKWSKELAEMILSGIIYDTGRFAYRNTHAEDMAAASEMIKHGASIESISQIIFFNYRIEAMQVFGQGLANTRTYLDDKLAIILLRNSELKSISSHEIEELSNYSASVQGALAGAFIREVEPGYFRISLRSRSDVRVDGVAAAIGGGGHPRASGCRAKGNVEEIIHLLTFEFGKVFREFEKQESQ